MGTVYQARDSRTGETVAVKTLHSSHPASMVFFKNEFRALADISHPHLVQLRELISHEGRLFLVMDYVAGTTFLSAVHASEPTPSGDRSTAQTELFAQPMPLPDDEAPVIPAAAYAIERLMAWLPPLAEALTALHDAGTLHNDLKPSNVMVDDRGRPIILDFGLVHQLGGGATLRPTRSSPRGGTAGYMSPEQARGQPLGPASDWYALGVMLFEALVGRRPTASERERGPDPAALWSQCPDSLGRLARALLHPDPAARAGADDVYRALGISRPARSPRPTAESVFVGRGQQIERLVAICERVRAGQGLMVGLSGQSGVGKTALATHVLRRRVSGFRLLEGRCHPQEHLPYKALDPIIDALSEELSGLDPELRAEVLPAAPSELLRLFPVLARVPGFEAPSAQTQRSPHQARRIAAGELRGILERLAASRPVALLFDDFQWGDEDTLAVLEVLSRPLPARLLVLATYRSEDAEGAFMSAALQVATAAGAMLMAVPPLDAAAQHELAARLLGGDSAEASARARIVASQSGGLPIFIEQLSRHIEAAEPRASAPGDTRSHLNAALRARWQGLPDVCAATLSLLAVAGQPLPHAVVRGVVGSGADRALVILQRTRLARAVGSEAKPRVGCYHDVVREAAISAMAPGERARWHRRLAETLSATGDADPERLYVHYRAGSDPERAFQHGLMAAERAEAALAFARAADLFSELVVLRPTDRGLRTRQAEALVRCGRARDAGRVLVELARSTTDPLEAGQLRLRAAEQLLHSGHLDEGLKLVDAELGRLGISASRGRAGAVASYLVQRALVRLIGSGARSTRRAAPAPGTLESLFAVGTGLALVDPLRAFDILSRYLLLAAACDEPDHLGRALALEACQVAAASVARWPDADDLLRRASEMCDRAGRRGATVGHIAGCTAVVRFQQGRWREAAEAARAAQAVVRRQIMESPYTVDTSRSYELFSLGYRGELRRLLDRGRGFGEDATDRGDLFGELFASVAQPVPLLLVAGQPRQALAACDDVLQRWTLPGYHLVHFWALRLRILVALYTGGGDALGTFDRDRVKLALSLLTTMPVMRVERLEIEGRAALDRAFSVGDRRALRRARRVARRLRSGPLRWGRGIGAHLEGLAWWAAGDPRRAAAVLASAKSELEAAELGLWARAATWRLGQLTGRAAWVEESVAWASAQSVAEPERLLTTFAPGPRCFTERRSR